MKGALRVAGCLTVVLFGATLAHADWASERSTPRRVQEEMAAEQARKENEMTPQEKMRRKEIAENRRTKVRKYVLNPFKRLKPHRHPAKAREEESRQAKKAEQKQNSNNRFGWLIPHRPSSSQTK